MCCAWILNPNTDQTINAIATRGFRSVMGVVAILR